MLSGCVGFAYYLLSANQGYKKAQYYVGRCFESGEGVPKRCVCGCVCGLPFLCTSVAGVVINIYLFIVCAAVY